MGVKCEGFFTGHSPTGSLPKRQQLPNDAFRFPPLSWTNSCAIIQHSISGKVNVMRCRAVGHLHSQEGAAEQNPSFVPPLSPSRAHLRRGGREKQSESVCPPARAHVIPISCSPSTPRCMNTRLPIGFFTQLPSACGAHAYVCARAALCLCFYVVCC